MPKNAIISGATGNLGSVVFKRLAEAGYSLDLLVNVLEHQVELRDGWDVKSHLADLTDERSSLELMNNIIQERSKIHLAVLIVGGFKAGSLEEVSMDDIQKMIDLNFKTAFNVIKPLLSTFKKNGNAGQIILIGARSGLDPNEGKKHVAYGLSKAMVVNLSEMINAEFAGTDITSTVIAPSTIDTPSSRNAMPDADFSSWVTPDEIADMILYLETPAGLKLRNTIFHLYGNA